MGRFLLTGAIDGRRDRAESIPEIIAHARTSAEKAATNAFLSLCSFAAAAKSSRVGTRLGTRQSRFNYIPPIHFRRRMRNARSNTRLLGCGSRFELTSSLNVRKDEEATMEILPQR